MRLSNWVLSAALALPVMVPAALHAQQPASSGEAHVADAATLDRLIAERVARDAEDRDAILRLLARPDVRDVAHDAGVDIARAEAAVSTLEGAELQQLANQARQVEEGLAGGASTIVISTTAIIIILLVVILIVVAAD